MYGSFVPRGILSLSVNVKSVPNHTAPTPFTCHQEPVKQEEGARASSQAPLQASRRPSARLRCVYNSGHTVYDPQVPPTVLRPQDDATTSQPYPGGRCQLPKWRPVSSSGGGGRSVVSHQKQESGQAPHQGTGASGRPPPTGLQPREGGEKICLLSFFFYHTKMLLLNWLILSALSVKGRKLQGCSSR